MHGHALLPTLSLVHYMERKAWRRYTKFHVNSPPKPWEQPKSSVGHVIPYQPMFQPPVLNPGSDMLEQDPEEVKLGWKEEEHTSVRAPSHCKVTCGKQSSREAGDQELTYRL